MKPTLIYDGDCGFCNRTVGRIRRHDTQQRIKYLPYQSVQDGQFTEADRARFKEAVHFLDTDGVLSYGGHVLPRVMQYLPKWRKRAWLFRLSGVLWFTARIYNHVARKRHLSGSACNG